VNSGGYAADRLGRLNVLYPMLMLSGLFCLAMWLPSTTPALVVAFACVYGFTSGIFISVMPAAVGQITAVEKLGARLGAFNTVAAVPVFVGTPVAGVLIRGEDSVGGYDPLIIYSVRSVVQSLLSYENCANDAFRVALYLREASSLLLPGLFMTKS
jgi:MFS family permease